MDRFGFAAINGSLIIPLLTKYSAETSGDLGRSSGKRKMALKSEASTAISGSPAATTRR